eukprot:gene29239-32557_t
MSHRPRRAAPAAALLGWHVLLIAAYPGWGSAVMRGRLILSVLAQLRSRHGARAAFLSLLVGDVACVFVKFPERQGSGGWDGLRGSEGVVDAMAVQTREHAEWLSALGQRAVVLPHPHGNLRGWSVARGVRSRMASVGLVVGDVKLNMPADVGALAAASCAAGATLTVVQSAWRERMEFLSHACPPDAHP